MRGKKRLKLAVVGSAMWVSGMLLAGDGAPGGTNTIFVEAESGAPEYVAPEVKGKEKPPAMPDKWMGVATAGASGGKVLTYPPKYFAPENDGMPVSISVPGKYRVWVRLLKKGPANANVCAMIRDPQNGQIIAVGLLDWRRIIPTETPYLKPEAPADGGKGFMWQSFDATFERPMKVMISFSGTGAYDRQVDCVILTTDQGLDPRKMPADQLANLGTANTSQVPQKAPEKGFVWAAGLPGRVEPYTAIADPTKRFFAGLINCGSVYYDGARLTQMGFNRDHVQGGYEKWGIANMLGVMEGFDDREFIKAHPSPEGRFVNSKGQVGTLFSLHYRPWQEAAKADLTRKMKEALAHDDGRPGFWRISAEEGGWLDYSPWAIEAFQTWLAGKHGSLETLNKRWGTQYKTFQEIKPALTYAEGRASFLEFRDFCSKSYAESVGRRIPIIKALDPHKRPCLGANSNLDIVVPYFMAFRPSDYEDLIRIGLKDEKYVAFDIYCADDDMGSAIDFFNSLGQGRKAINQEFSNHVVDPRIASRTYWEQVGKGVHGIHLFMFQDPPGHPSYPKWGLTSQDGSPKLKLGAYSDAAQEVHRLEPMLMAASPTNAVKPIALYWSRIDIGLDAPHDSLYGHSFNVPLRIYEVLRGLGYNVRWITPRQIAEGELEGVGALVMSGVNHVPGDAANKIESWVKAGGAIVADSWPGAFDEYGQPQATLAPMFGVRPTPKKPAAGAKPQPMIEESKQGYGEVTDAAVLRERYYEKIDEMAQQPGATHPIAKAMGDFMIAGYAPERVECTGGKIIGMTHGGLPGAVVNDYGKGKTLYSAFLLGTMYEAAPTRYEWDSSHSGQSYARLMDAFLKFANVPRASQVTGLPANVAAKMRVEAPLVAADGNTLIGIISLNDAPVPAFDLSVKLPAQAGPFAKVYAVSEGSRKLTPLAFEVKDGALKVKVPSFDIRAMLVAVKETGPLVALDLKNVTRGAAGMAVIAPGQTFSVEATVHNPSSKALAAGKVTFTLPSGWQQSALEMPVPAIQAGGQAGVAVNIKSPDLAGEGRVLPILTRFESGSVQSTPCAEMVWWGMGARVAAKE